MGFNKGVLKRTPLVGQEMRSYLNIDPSIASKASLAFNAAQAEGLQDYEAGTLYFRDSNFDRVGFTVSRSTTATFINKAQLIATAAANVPRIDFSGEAKLLEELSRTNVLPGADTFFLTPFLPVNVTTTTGISTLIDGLTGTRVQAVGGIGSVAYRCPSVPRDPIHNYSCFVKPESGTHLITFDSDGSRPFARFTWNGSTYTPANLTTATVVGSNAKVKSYPNGWYRLSACAFQSGGPQREFRPEITDISDGGRFIIVGAQAVPGTYPTSYIPTSISSVVTRNADSRTITTLQSGSYLGATAGTWYNSFDEVQEGDVWVLSNGTQSTKLILESGDWKLEENGGTKTTIGSYSKGDKIAVRWSGSDIGAVLNGGSEVTTTVAYGQGYTTYSKGTIGVIETKQEIAFPTQLTVAECQTLTS